jgi:hypothetical protein
MVTEVGSSAPTSTPGQVHTNAMGSLIFASRNIPLRMENALRV